MAAVVALKTLPILPLVNKLNYFFYCQYCYIILLHCCKMYLYCIIVVCKMSLYVCVCTNVVYMLCVYCIYNYVNKFEARSLFSTSYLKKYILQIQTQKDINGLFTYSKMQLLSRKERNKKATNIDMSNPYCMCIHIF